MVGRVKKARDMFVIGLTGSIGAGKSEVAKILRGLGAQVIDADPLGHEVYRPDTPGWQEVVDEFGSGFLTESGEVDRAILGEKVFSDPRALRRLNSITHPRIRSVVENRLQQMEAEEARVAVVEAVGLLEAGWRDIVDDVWVVVAEETDVVERVHSARGLSEDEIESRIRSQMGQNERISHADAVIYNYGNLNDLEHEVRHVWESRAPERKEA